MGMCREVKKENQFPRQVRSEDEGFSLSGNFHFLGEIFHGVTLLFLGAAIFAPSPHLQVKEKEINRV